MMEKTRLWEHNGSLALTLPPELTARLNLSPGDPVVIIETGGGILVARRDSDSARALESGMRIADKYQNALGELASGGNSR